EASRSLPARAHPADGALPAGTVEIKVLAYYTPQAAAETGDIAGHIQSGIDYANDVFSNSQM
ncbi:MAG: hypothetical protein GWN73_04875, partial [Actinobacteria bacterium]|nr:hypothetical protein [Actinomycetota bacterium]NIU64797.1 hypothetical protein [Actinomycetota bacterium]NIW26598.1 hypothetical protein [Actinomycetota bacterium]